MRNRHNLRARARTGAIAALAACAAIGCSLAARADDDEAASPNVADSETDHPRLLSPTLGRPLFVEPGGTFLVVARVPRASGTISFDLVHPGPPSQRHRLACELGEIRKVAAGEAVRVRVPPTVPQRTYDIEIRCDGTQLVGRHCVAVAQVDHAIRLVHLANMNIGDIGAHRFDTRLIDEINLIAPTLIVATGDYLDATHPNPPAGWLQLANYLARFEAPVLLACGDHDVMELYSQYAAPSPIGLIDVGRHRGVVLLDHPGAPISADPEQLRWVEHTLAQPGFDGLTFVVTHDDSPNLLRYWQQRGTLTRMIRAGRVGLWFAGGHRDWDGRTLADLLNAARPMVYLRTHQSSTATRDGAAGTSHYRIVDVVDDTVIFPQPTVEPPATPPSTPVGHLQATFDGPNDGSRSRLAFSAVSNLPYRLNRLALWLRLQKQAGQVPWCQGARLEQVIDLDTQWECRVRLDLPDKGALWAVAGSGPKPEPPAVSVRFDTEEAIRFRQCVTPEGLTFLRLTSAPPVVYVNNDGDVATEVSPLARLDGDPVAYRPLTGDARFATAYRLRLQPGERLALQLDLSAARVAPGRRELQVYVRGAGGGAPFCRAVDVVVDE